MCTAPRWAFSAQMQDVRLSVNFEIEHEHNPLSSFLTTYTNANIEAMEKKKKEKKKQKNKVNRKKNPPPSHEEDSSIIRALYFDIEGVAVHDFIRAIRSHEGSRNIPEEEMELVWPILQTKSLLFLQSNAHELFDEATREWLRQLDPFQHDDPKILSSIELLKTEKHEGIYNTMRSIWATKEEYLTNFKPSMFNLFSEHYLSTEALNRLRNRTKAQQATSGSEVFALFKAMPSDLIWTIASYLVHPLDVINLSKCNKALYGACNEPYVWNGLCKLYGIKPYCSNVKKSFAAHALRPVEQILYAQDKFNTRYNHLVIPSEDLRVHDYTTILEKYMIASKGITALVLLVDMRRVTKRLQSYKYHPNYIHENIELLKELIVESAKQPHAPSEFMVRFIYCHELNYEAEREAIAQEFPNLEFHDDKKAFVRSVVKMFYETNPIRDNAYANRWEPNLSVLVIPKDIDAEAFLQQLALAYLEPIGGLAI